MERLKYKLLSVVLLIACNATSAMAQDAVIRKNLGDRITQLPKIDEISKTPVPGIFEIRVNGTDIYYTDAQANYLIQGNLIDTKQRRNLTQERVDKLNAIHFDALPIKDALTIVRGNGQRRLALFEDPNCGYCKKFERDLLKVSNVTIHLFLYPILGASSVDKAKNIWCAKDKVKTWQDWMVRDIAPLDATCDREALVRNVELGRKYKISGTPTIVFADGSRVPGAIGSDQIELRLAQQTTKSP